VETKRRHVVMVAYHFPPATAVGAQRPALLVEALLAAGVDVDVVRACLPGESPGTEERESRGDGAVLRVHAVASGRGLRELARDVYRATRRLLRRLRGADTVHAPASAPARSAPSPDQVYARDRFSRGRRWALSLLRVPDDHQAFIGPALRRIMASTVRSHSVIYCSAPPFSALVASRLAAIARRVPLIAELRDPWTDNPARGAHTRSALADAAQSALERLCVGHASRVVTVTESVADTLRRRYRRLSTDDRVLAIPTGIAADAWHDAPPPKHGASNSVARVVYAGTLYLARDPRPVLAALAHLRGSSCATERQVHLDLVGQCAEYRGTAVSRWVDELGLSGAVHIHAEEPRSRVLQRLRRADALLLLARGQPDQIPHKLYEYLGARVPIVALVDPGGATERLLRRLGGHHIVADDDPLAVARAIAAAVAPGSSAANGGSDSAGAQICFPSEHVVDAMCACDGASLDALRSQCQMERLVRLVRDSDDIVTHPER
jgi:glycosyltransferase involved in cell wall biosynthesis